MRVSTLVFIAMAIFFGMKATQSLGMAVEKLQTQHLQKMESALANLE